MKLRLLICLFCISILAGCRKDELVEPDIPPVNNPELPQIPVKLGIASVFQSNMVIQRDKPLKIWGTSIPLSKVLLTVSWQQSSFEITSNSSGRWEATIPSAEANAVPQTISVSTGNQQPLQLNNILIGDVWICSGQSNMVMPVGRLLPSFRGVENYESEIAAADHPLIRSFTVGEDYKAQPSVELTVASKWKVCSPETAGDLSAVAYFFARKIQADINVPIGIIISAVNGTTCDAWTDKESIRSDVLLEKLYGGSSRASRLFNGMINPLKELGIKGFIWYQGENDKGLDPPEIYTRLNSALIKGWRSIFNQGELPFFYVQMCPFDFSGTGNILLNSYAKFREAQANIRSAAPNTGMAVTMDVGELSSHHPVYKKPVGERLALLALNKVYGRNIQSVGPQYSSFSQSGNSVTVNFVSGTSSGLQTLNNAALRQYFYVAGSDKVFRLATATINGDKISLAIPSGTALPVISVRYAFTDFPVTNLQNSAGLPMEPFRSDNWSN